ncbi:carbohydrate ABC transporter permease [Arthrobacter flavus]
MSGGFVMVFPFLWQIMMSLSSQAESMSVPPSLWPEVAQWGNYATVFDRVPFARQFLISVVVTILTVVGQVIFCSMAGYAFARLRFWGSGAILAIVLSILMVPTQVYLIPQYQIVQSLGGLNTIWGIVLPGVFSAFGTFLMRQAFLGLPHELEEAARIDGANPFQLFWRVLLPLTKPSLSALTIITILFAWNNLLWPLVITTDAADMPLVVGLANLQGQYTTDYPVLMAASLMAMAPVLLLFILLQRRVVDGLAHSGLK